ncbi:MAG TPA: alpha/beta hydrolase [Burkholderiales bacterium]|jgi:pimeloyl-ACP methyl ester carboxylesterase|nr:alpha/beta hydrolase [Burkholderiales bacterium]
MRTELISIATPTVPLDGVYYEPEGGAKAGGVLLFHGNTMNFYTGAPRFLPPVLTELGFACLAFNRRGRDILSIFNSRAMVGGALQTAAEGIEDNRLAAQWFAGKGYKDPVVIGHSNGGMLAVRHVADHPQTRAMVLLSAHRGGKTAVEDTSSAGMMAADRVEEFTERAEQMVAAGQGRELMLMPGWWYAISAESYLDRKHNTPNVVELAPRIKCPTLYVRGDQEPMDRYPAEEFRAAAGGPCQVEIVANCDHFYNKAEPAIQGLVAGWLKSTLKL